ncbi:MAG: hypothetical protein HY883_07220 [Deltaproteobacteria bacterium]|nr:hypothetical protein [Deltaproteobacteria bacterium]
MKKFALSSAIIAVILIACAATLPEIIVKADKDLLKEAFNTAYDRGLMLGYLADNIDREDWFIVFTKKTGQTDISIRVELDREKDPPEFKITAKTLGSELISTTHLAGDMDRIAEAIKQCCGITVKKKGGTN